MENVKHFVFDLTCDITGDLEVKFFELYLKDLVQAFRLPFEFSPRLLASEKDGGGGATPPPPPAEGRGRTRPSRARVNISYH